MSEKTHDTGFAWFPASHWIRAHTRQSVRLDLIAGLSLAAFVIPESLAYASLAQLPPVTGLYCYLVEGIAYAIFGSSRQLAVGPTSAMSLVIATSVVTMTDGDLSRALALASAVALMVAIISIAVAIGFRINVAEMFMARGLRSPWWGSAPQPDCSGCSCR